VSVDLDPNGFAVRVSDDVTLVTPGLRGQAAESPTTRGRTRGAVGPSDPLEEALRSQDVETQHLIEIRDTQEVPGVGATRALGARHGEEAIEVQVRPPPEGWEQFVLHHDESDVITWHFASGGDGAAQPGGAITRGGVSAGTRTYFIPRGVAGAPREPGSRGILTSLGKKVLRVVAFKAAGVLIQKGTSLWFGKWEEKNRPYQLRMLTPENYVEPEAPTPQWEALSEGRSLLLVHGTHTRSHVELSHAPMDFVKELYERYEGRLFAFDHPTLTMTPHQNIEWFLDAVPRSVELDLDVLSISRGGLVARTLAAEQGREARRIHIGKVVFIATPNAGTFLADPKHLNDFIDSYSNVFDLLPDTPVTIVLESIVGIAKLIAVNALKGLRGIQCMVPGGDFLSELDQRGVFADEHFALASDFEPVEPGLKRFVMDALLDVFQKEANDMVVPTAGVYEGSASPPFPIGQVDRLVFDRSKGIRHSDYVRDPQARAAIMTWLGP
jgi:hypothetical protein